MYTIKDIADAAGVSKPTVRKWIKDLDIPVETIGKDWKESTGKLSDDFPVDASGKKPGTVLISDDNAVFLIGKLTGKDRKVFPESTGKDRKALESEKTDHSINQDDREVIHTDAMTELLLAEKDARIADLTRQIEDLKGRIERADQRNDEVEGRLSLVFSMLAEKDQQIRRLTALDMDAREETSETADEDDHLNDDQEINDHVTDPDPGQDHVARTTDSDPAAVNSPSYPADRGRSRGIVGKFKNFFNLR